MKRNKEQWESWSSSLAKWSLCKTRETLIITESSSFRCFIRFLPLFYSRY